LRRVVNDSSMNSSESDPAVPDVVGSDVASDTAQPAEAEVQPDSTTETNDGENIKDQLLRTLADFDNFRKRSRREVADAERIAREDLLRELLPVFDNLERASQHAVGSTDVQSLSEGIQIVLRQFLETLNKLGVERVRSVGCPFDPTVHEAVQQVESAELPAGSVAQELLAGYQMGDRLIRPAMVVVVKPSLG
jgi:molecular chaperone GrpE